MVEPVASLVHDIWARWIEYVFSKSKANDDFSYTIPPDLARRWIRQMITPYEDLSEEERYSDRKIANEILAVIEEEKHSWD